MKPMNIPGNQKKDGIFLDPVFHSEFPGYPFLDAELLQLALSLPSSPPCPDSEASQLAADGGKGALRHVARSLRAPKRIAERRKRAAQYGSRIYNALKILSNEAGKQQEDTRYHQANYVMSVPGSSHSPVALLFTSGYHSIQVYCLLRSWRCEIACIIPPSEESAQIRAHEFGRDVKVPVLGLSAPVDPRVTIWQLDWSVESGSWGFWSAGCCLRACVWFGSLGVVCSCLWLCWSSSLCPGVGLLSCLAIKYATNRAWRYDTSSAEISGEVASGLHHCISTRKPIYFSKSCGRCIQRRRMIQMQGWSTATLFLVLSCHVASGRSTRWVWRWLLRLKSKK